MERSPAERLAEALAAITRSWGDSALGFAPSVRPPAGGTSVGTGFAALDAALGEGMGLGQAVALCGAPTAGASTLALRILGRSQAEGLASAYIDLPRTFDPAYARACGVDLAELLLVHPNDAREALGVCRALLTSRTAELVVLDDLDHLCRTPDDAALLASALPLLRPSLRRSGGLLLLRCPPAAQGLPPGLDLALDLRRTGWLWERTRVCGYLTEAVIWRARGPRAGQVVPLTIEIAPPGGKGPA